jgi:hypothetical protein
MSKGGAIAMTNSHLLVRLAEKINGRLRQQFF